MGPDLATNNSYHFFGDLWLENPEAHLSTEELEKLRSLEPLIRQLERRREGIILFPVFKSPMLMITYRGLL